MKYKLKQKVKVREEYYGRMAEAIINLDGRLTPVEIAFMEHEPMIITNRIERHTQFGNIYLLTIGPRGRNFYFIEDALRALKKLPPKDFKPLGEVEWLDKVQKNFQEG